MTVSRKFGQNIKDNIQYTIYNIKADQYSMAKKSALNMLALAEKALRENSTLERLVLMEYPPRADSEQLGEISQYGNTVLRTEVNKSEFRRQIVVGSMGNLKYSSLEEMVDRFGPRNVHPRFDGIHLRPKISNG